MVRIVVPAVADVVEPSLVPEAHEAVQEGHGVVQPSPPALAKFGQSRRLPWSNKTK